MKILRLKQIVEATGRCRASIYSDISEELFVPPCRWGRSSVWPADEIESIIKARIAGKTDDEIRQLVSDLVAARQLAA